MTRPELDAAFADALARKSSALTAQDGDTIRAASAEILELARAILSRPSASGRPSHLLPAQMEALFWAAYHPVRFAPAGMDEASRIAFADNVAWLESIGYVFSPKERKIVDELPFCGVPELFRRWVMARLADGFSPDPRLGVKTAFAWYRDHPRDEVPEELVRYLAEHLDLDRRDFPFYYGKLLSRLGRGAGRAGECARSAKEKPSDFRRWVALAETQVAVPRRIVACLAKALTCTILPADEAPRIRASLERRLRAAANLIGRPAPARLDAQALARLAEPTRSFLIANVPVTKGVLRGVKVAKDGRRLAEIAYVDATGRDAVLTVPLSPELARLQSGAELRMRLVRHGEVDRLVDLTAPVPPSPRRKPSPRRGLS